MNVKIELIDDLESEEVLIRCKKIDENILKIQQFILEQTMSDISIVFYKQNQEFYFPLEDLFFIETEGESLYAHTLNDAYRIKYRLHELENTLPRNFLRISKSTIVNINHIYSITRNVTASSMVQFRNSHKQVYVSRLYYKQLRLRINERNYYEK